jgi:hypothetical protein
MRSLSRRIGFGRALLISVVAMISAGFARPVDGAQLPPPASQVKQPVLRVPSLTYNKWIPEGRRRLVHGSLLACGDHEFVHVQSDHGTDSAVAQFRLPAPYTTVGELHDCQRFPTTNGEFGPLAAIFASFSQTARDSTPVVRPTPNKAVALVVSDGYYPRLGIEPANNCLYLWRPRGMAFQARMLPVGSADSLCTKALDLRKPIGTPLRVVGQALPPGLGPLPQEALPRGVRWDLDPERALTYISIRCGGRWCEIGPMTGWTSSETYSVGTPGGRYRVVHGIKGWYDEQPLPYPVDADGNPVSTAALASRLVPWVTGTVVPDTGLRSHPDPTDFDNKWIPAARVHFWGQPGAYETKYGFKPGEFAANVNLISVCRIPVGATQSCDTWTPPPGICSNYAATDPAASWYARIQPPGLPPVYRCVQYQRHGGHGPWFSARWRWLSRPSGTGQSVSVTGIGMPVFPSITNVGNSPIALVGDELVGIWHWCADGCCTIW